MKILIFSNLSIITLPIIIFFKFFNFEILFLSIERYLQNRKFIKFLSLFKINWFNYQNYKFDHIKTEKEIEVPKFSKKLSRKVSEQFWSKSLENVFINKSYLTACLDRYIYRESENTVEVMAVAKNFEKMKNKVYLWIPNNLISKKINDEIYHLKNLNIFPNFYIIIPIIIFVFNIFVKILKSILFKILKRNTAKNKKTKTILNYDNFKVACYPHKGIYYGKLFLKDYFYSYNVNDPFHFEKILHIEWDVNDVEQISKDYYEKNNIKYLYWKTFGNNLEISKKTIFFWLKNIKLFLVLIKFDVQIFFYFFKSAFQVFRSLQNLNKLKNLKLILACHEELFPIELSVACKKKNIITISIQDRMYISNVIPLFIFDYYFTAGEKSKNLTKNRMPDPFVKHYKDLYLIKTDKINEIENFENQQINFSNSKLKCIVMDYKSTSNWYLNGRAIAQNWRLNKDYYKIILKLAKNHSQINFFIKGKNYEWKKIPFFKEILEEINETKNIFILDDEKKWTPNESIKFGDLAIARTTSLAEEMLFLGKPVIIYNDMGRYPERVFDYGKRIQASNYKEISEKLDLILEDYNKFNSQLNEDRNKLFYKKEPGKLHKEMNKIFLNNSSAI